MVVSLDSWLESNKEEEEPQHALHPQTCVVVTEAGSYFRLIDSCITQLKAQGPSRTCNESKEEETKNTPSERDFFIDNLLVRICLIIEMILVDRPCAMGV